MKRECCGGRRTARPIRVCIVLLFLFGVTLPSIATERDSSSNTGTKRALLLFGHPGTKTYEQIYRRSAEKLHAGLVNRLAFSDENVWVRYGTPAKTEDGPDFAGYRGPATKAGIANDVAELTELLDAKDTLWVIVVSHSHFDGRRVFLNLPGRDVDQEEFGKLFDNVRCGQQVFFVTCPASGHFIPGLSQEGRVVITATEADVEVNEAQFHWYLGAVLKNMANNEEDADRDEDGRITLLDVYLSVVRLVMTDYRDNEYIATEHALLDDNGDGRGTELQLDDLEPELGGLVVRRPLRVVIRPPGDGALAASIELPFSDAVKSTPEPSEDSR